MNNPRALTFLFIGALALIGCTLILAQHPTVKISATPSLYSPMMSTTVGIRLTPWYSGPPSKFLQYHWSADYGTFVRWEPPDYTVTDLGNNTIVTNGVVYWTYLPTTPGEEPEEVLVSVSVEDARIGKGLAYGEITLTRNDRGYETAVMAAPSFVHPIPW